MQVFIGFDEREAVSADVYRYSIVKNSTIPLHIEYLIQDELRREKTYWRAKDLKASTDFSLTRFLVPYLSNYGGWALFADCDMLMTVDIKELRDLADPKYAVQVVKHDYIPKSTIKMDNVAPNASYPKKNWSSFVLWNCEHPSNRDLTLEVVNNASPSYLHRFEWLQEEEIGELDITWNFLVGEFNKPPFIPKNIHWTLGGVWLGEQFKDSDFTDLWQQYKAELDVSRNLSH